MSATTPSRSAADEHEKRSGRTVRALLAVIGSVAVRGPAIEWVATHRRGEDPAGVSLSPNVKTGPPTRPAER